MREVNKQKVAPMGAYRGKSGIRFLRYFNELNPFFGENAPVWRTQGFTFSLLTGTYRVFEVLDYYR